MLGSGNIGPPHHGRPTAHGMHRLAGGIGGMTRGFNNGKYFNYTYIKEIFQHKPELHAFMYFANNSD